MQVVFALAVVTFSGRFVPSCAARSWLLAGVALSLVNVLPPLVRARAPAHDTNNRAIN
jgi:hypothetical protein